MMNAHQRVSLISSAFSARSLSLRRSARLPVQLPPAQPTSADVPGWTLGWRGHGGQSRRGDTAGRGRMTRKTPLALAVLFRLAQHTCAGLSEDSFISFVWDLLKRLFCLTAD